jgi:hypothetical protein
MPPSGRSRHSAIYDPVRDRMVVFGGDGSDTYNDVWALSLAGAPAWTELTPTGAPPSVRSGHSAIYDPVHDRMVIFGGSYYEYSTHYLYDVWELSLAGAPAWTELTPTGAPPMGRDSHSAIYDPVRDRMVVFGGYNHDDPRFGLILDDVWAMSLAGTPAWTELMQLGTGPARDGHSAIYDPMRDRMVVFGGWVTNDVWSLSLADTPAWTALTPSGTPPSRRAGQSAIYDPVRDRMVVYGGTYISLLDDVWGLSLASPPGWMALTPAGAPGWTALTPTGTPPHGRALHSATYDLAADCMVVFGGTYYDGARYRLNDTWVLSLSGATGWIPLYPSGTLPSRRSGQSAIYDPVRDRIVVFAGLDDMYNLCNEVWTFSLTGDPAWTALAPTGTPPSARMLQCAIYDPVRDRMVVFGGENEYGPVGDVWVLSLAGTPAWTALTPGGQPPNGREAQSAIYDPLRDRMLVFGGLDDSYAYRNDVWALSLAGTPAWTALAPAGPLPGPREFHSAIYDPPRDRMVVFGGEYYDGSEHFLDDTWALSLAGASVWTELTPGGSSPGGRFEHGAIYDAARDRMVAFGGRDDSFYYNDVWALGWSAAVAVDGPEARPLISGLRPPAPNPSRGMTAVSYCLARAGRVHLGVYDVGGRLVRSLADGERSAGTETVVWDGASELGTKLRAGVYFVRLVAPGIRETRKMILLR